MHRQQFKTTIAAPRDAVWETLWNDATYREWTSVFSPGSWADTDWKKGSKVRFLDADNNGMASVIEENRKNEFLSIRHLGITIKNGVEQPRTEESKEWEGFEEYTLEDEGTNTLLTVDLEFGNIPTEMLDMFNGLFPKALEKIKQISEKQTQKVNV